MVKCSPGKIINPETGKCVKRDGRIGKKILAQRKANAPLTKNGKILNPATGKYVKRDGKIGRSILAKRGISPVKRRVKSTAASTSKKPQTKGDKILNPAIGKYVKRDGRIGKSILAKRGISPAKKVTIKRAKSMPAKTMKKPVKSKLREKYANCVLDVASKQSQACVRQISMGGIQPGDLVNGKRCYNPYSICTKSTKRKGFRGTTGYFDNRDYLEKLPDSKIKTIALLKSPKVKISRPFNRENVIKQLVNLD